MKFKLIVLIIFAHTKTFSQELVSNLSEHFTQGGYDFTMSVGESVVDFYDNSDNSFLVGVQQPLYDNLFGLPSTLFSSISASPNQIPGDGISTSNISVTLRDSDQELIKIGGYVVEILSTEGMLSVVTDNNDGIYTSILTSPNYPGSALLSFELSGFEANDYKTVDFLAFCAVLSNTLNLNPMNGFQSGVFRAQRTINSDGVVNVGKDVEFYAGESITLEPGFTVEGGATFSAKIQNCVESSPRNNLSIEQDSEINTEVYLTVYPNPTNEIVSLKFSLNESSTVSITIFNSSGELVKKVAERTLLNKGTHNSTVNVKDLVAGIYSIQLLTNNIKIARNLVIVKN